MLKIWARKDSNLRPSGYEPPALPLSYGPLKERVNYTTEDIGFSWAALPARNNRPEKNEPCYGVPPGSLAVIIAPAHPRIPSPEGRRVPQAD